MYALRPVIVGELAEPASPPETMTVRDCLRSIKKNIEVALAF
jgi:hypothetical protein